MASSTWLGWATPAVHAEPVEQAIPRASSSISSASPSQPGKEKCAFPGSLPGPGGAPFSTASGTAALTCGDQVVAQGGQPLGLVGPVLGSDLHRRRERPDRRHVEGAGADIALLAAAMQHRHRLRAPGQQQRADADRAADLVRGDGQRGGTAGRQADRQLAGRLDGVGVKRDLMLGGELGQVGDRLHRADLVIGPHDADDRHTGRIAFDRVGQRRRA